MILLPRDAAYFWSSSHHYVGVFIGQVHAPGDIFDGAARVPIGIRTLCQTSNAVAKVAMWRKHSKLRKDNYCEIQTLERQCGPVSNTAAVCSGVLERVAPI